MSAHANAFGWQVLINDDGDRRDGMLIHTHFNRADAVKHAKACAEQGRWMNIPVGCAMVFEGLRGPEVACFHHNPAATGSAK